MRSFQAAHFIGGQTDVTYVSGEERPERKQVGFLVRVGDFPVEHIILDDRFDCRLFVELRHGELLRKRRSGVRRGNLYVFVEERHEVFQLVDLVAKDLVKDGGPLLGDLGDTAVEESVSVRDEHGVDVAYAGENLTPDVGELGHHGLAEQLCVRVLPSAGLPLGAFVIPSLSRYRERVVEAADDGRSRRRIMEVLGIAAERLEVTRFLVDDAPAGVPVGIVREEVDGGKVILGLLPGPRTLVLDDADLL